MPAMPSSDPRTMSDEPPGLDAPCHRPSTASTTPNAISTLPMEPERSHTHKAMPLRVTSLPSTTDNNHVIVIANSTRPTPRSSASTALEDRDRVDRRARCVRQSQRQNRDQELPTLAPLARRGQVIQPGIVEDPQTHGDDADLVDRI